MAVLVEKQLVGVVVAERIGNDGLDARPVEGVGDEDIELAIAVDVSHRAGRVAEHARADPGIGGDIAEGFVAVVAEEPIALHPSQDIQVLVTVVVDVAEAHTRAVHVFGADSGRCAFVYERGLTRLLNLVLIQTVVASRTIGDVDVQVTISVVVK